MEVLKNNMTRFTPNERYFINRCENIKNMKIAKVLFDDSSVRIRYFNDSDTFVTLVCDQYGYQYFVNRDGYEMCDYGFIDFNDFDINNLLVKYKNIYN